ncbi:MAG: hypothetical protein Q9N34_07680 [Aquificota bacterium]|nr:hypothetical protein [Aquificota bacterium]
MGRTAEASGYRVYLVGGAVRDMILGREVKDVDFVVEGDAVDLAKRVAERFGADLHPFPEFGTAHLKVGNFKLEFATARRETYPRPGSYPKVERASLKEDLIRRDFTINALAVSINPGDFSTLIDFFGGLKDLKEGSDKGPASCQLHRGPGEGSEGSEICGKVQLQNIQKHRETPQAGGKARAS